MKIFLVIFLILTSCTSKRNIISSKNIESKDSISIQTLKQTAITSDEIVELNIEETIQETFSDTTKKTVSRVINRKIQQTSKKGVVSVSNEECDTIHIKETGTLETQGKPTINESSNVGLKYVFYILIVILILYVVYRIK